MSLAVLLETLRTAQECISVKTIQIGHELNENSSFTLPVY
jgi:hypothetical protein